MEAWELELVEKVDALARGQFADGAAKSDREGSFSKENMDSLRELGIPGMGLSKDIGGLGISVEGQTRVIEAIAYGDASTAVALNMHLFGTGFMESIPMFPHKDAVLKDVATTGATMCPPGSIPMGQLDNRTASSGFTGVEDGDEIVINGRTGFASGSDGATYVFVGGTIDRGEGNEADIVLSLPRIGTAGLDVQNNWNAMGLRGTASHDVVCTDVRVPKSEAMVVPAAMARMAAEAANANPVAAQQRGGAGALGIAAIWLGLAQAAFDETIAYVQKRHGMMATTSTAFGPAVGLRSDEAWAQIGIGEMEHWLETGRIVLYDTVRRLDTAFPSPADFSRHMIRTIYHLRRMSEEVSAGAMRVCGAHAYVKGKNLERIFRDMVGGNVMAWKTDQLRLNLGQGALGMPVSLGGPVGA